MRPLVRQAVVTGDIPSPGPGTPLHLLSHMLHINRVIGIPSRRWSSFIEKFANSFVLWLFLRRKNSSDRISAHIGQIDRDLDQIDLDQIDQIAPQLLSWEVDVQDLFTCSTGPSQETCPIHNRSCRSYGFYIPGNMI